MSDDVTLRLLADIRDEIRKTNERLELTNNRLDTTNERLENLGRELRAEMLASEMRAATRIVEQTVATRNLYDLLQNRFELRDRVERCEQDIAEIKQRL